MHSSAGIVSARKRMIRESVMIKWNERVSNTAEEDLMVRNKRQQDDDFCRALRAALCTGTEGCPEGVSTEPSTKKPILNYRPSNNVR